jgi:hypothetical protein
MTDQLTFRPPTRTSPRHQAFSVRQPLPGVTARPTNGHARPNRVPDVSRCDRGASAAPRSALHRLWLDALADEARHVAPFERMATVLLAFVSVVMLLVAFGATTRLVTGWDAFVAFAQRMIL